jgi:hypothetical protein
MKICIELDEEMKEQWTRIKSHLEYAFKHAHGMPVSLPDYIVFKGLLACFENEVLDFPSQFTTEEVEVICKEKRLP